MKIKIESLTKDGLQLREAISEDVVAEYAEAMRGGAVFPPVTAFFDGKRTYLADGFHRVEAAQRAGLREIDADVRKGDYYAAEAFACGANSVTPRTYETKKRCVMRLWEHRKEHFGKDDPSDREIANLAKLPRSTVRNIILQLANVGQLARPKTVTGKDGVTRARTLPTRALPTQRQPAGRLAPPTRAADGTTVTDATNGTGGKCAYADKDGLCTNEKMQGGGFKCCHCFGFTAVKKGYHIGADGKQHADGVLLDRFGVEIPDALRAVFNSTHLADWEHRISMVKSEIKGARALGNPIAKGLQRAVIELDNAYHEVKAAEPWCVCRVCQGQGCKACGDNGYQTEEQYKRNPEEMK